MEICTLPAEEIRELAERATTRGSSIAFQSTLAAAAQTVQRALHGEEAAQEAALSLAQRAALDGMTGELRTLADALQASLDAQGRCLMPACTEDKKRTFWPIRRADRPEPTPRPTWWFSLTEVIETLEEGADRMDALASGQPDDAPSRVLGEATADLLRGHHDRLLVEAERWIN